MKVFISWSGAKSLAVAEVLREELPCLIQDLETFVSSEDIEKGSAWFQSITTELDKSGFGIICLTAENLHSRWVHFEAGVLAGRFTQTKVAPLLIELDQAYLVCRITWRRRRYSSWRISDFGKWRISYLNFPTARAAGVN